MLTDQPIQVTINGEPRNVRSGLTLTGLLAEIGVDPGRVAVELNREIVRKPAWDSTPVEAGARLEIVEFVGGG